MFKLIGVSGLVFVGSSIWLSVVLLNGSATSSWTPVEARVVSNEETGWTKYDSGISSVVEYEVDGLPYKATITDYLVKGKSVVYVDPDDPTNVVGVSGPRIQDYGRPLLVTIVTGAFLIVLVLIAFSPKED